MVTTCTAFLCLAVTAASVQLVTSSFPDQAGQEQCLVDQLFHTIANLSRDLSAIRDEMTMLRNETKNLKVTLEARIDRLEADNKRLNRTAAVPAIPDFVTSLRGGRCDAETFGQIYLDSRNNLLVLCNGSNWKTASVEDLSCVQRAPESCSQLYEANCTVYQHSGSYWLKGQTEGQYYRAYCDMRRGLGGWTLVGKAQGNTSEWAPRSAYWYNSELIRPDTADDLTSASAAKNEGWLTVKGRKLRVCYDGPFNSCAVFTHGLNVSLSELFLNRFRVPVAEGYSLQSLADAFNVGPSLFQKDAGIQWCGLNLGDGCDSSINPNTGNPHTICRIGCIGDNKATACRFDDYALGIGVSSCSDGHGCFRTGTSTPSLHYRDDMRKSNSKLGGLFQQTAYIYVQ